MGNPLDVKIEDKEIHRLLDRVAAKGKDMTPFMRVASGILLHGVEENFQQGGRPNWKPSQRVKKYGGQTLIDTTHLVKSIHPGYNNRQAWAATNDRRAKIHHYGGVIRHPGGERTLHFRQYKKGRHAGKTLFAKKSRAQYGQKTFVKAYTITMPKRPFMCITDKEIKEILKAGEEFLKSG